VSPRAAAARLHGRLLAHDVRVLVEHSLVADTRKWAFFRVADHRVVATLEFTQKYLVVTDDDTYYTQLAENLRGVLARARELSGPQVA
jgi:hypothetical protein